MKIKLLLFFSVLAFALNAQTTISSPGWYRVGETSFSEADGVLNIVDSQNDTLGIYFYTTFTNNFNQVFRSIYMQGVNEHPGSTVTNFRYHYNTINDPVYLEVYVAAASTLNLSYENGNSVNNITPIDFQAPSIPAGYETISVKVGSLEFTNRFKQPIDSPGSSTDLDADPLNEWQKANEVFFDYQSSKIYGNPTELQEALDSVFLRLIDPNVNENFLSLRKANGEEALGFYYRDDESTLIIGDAMGAITWNNDKNNDFISISTGGSGQKLEYPLASVMIGKATTVNCTDCNSFVTVGYQTAFHTKNGKNYIAIGTDAAFNCDTLNDSNILGRHQFFKGDGSVMCHTEDVNVLGVDGYALTEDALRIGGIGNLQWVNLVEGRDLYSEGEGVGRYRNYAQETYGTGFQAVGSTVAQTNQSGTYRVIAKGFRALTNTDSLAYVMADGAQAGYMYFWDEDFDSKFSIYKGDFAGQNTYGERNLFIGYRAGAKNAPENVNDALCIGNRAGDLWIGSGEGAIDISNTAQPLIYMNFYQDLLKANGEFAIRDCNTGAEFTQLLLRDTVTGKVGTGNLDISNIDWSTTPEHSSNTDAFNALGENELWVSDGTGSVNKGVLSITYNPAN